MTTGRTGLAGEKHLVTGGAGFIGAHLVRALAGAGATVTVLDDLSSGSRDALSGLDIDLVEGSILDLPLLDGSVAGQDMVWHLAADPDVRTGETAPARQFQINVVGTQNLLQAMLEQDVQRFAFTSTSTVYGDAPIPTPEDHHPLRPISVYGASKLAGEALAQAWSAAAQGQALLYRFANVVGPGATHGVIVDFVRKLRDDPSRLEILGDGRQTKSYVSVADTVSGMLQPVREAELGPGAHAFNIGSRDAIPVTAIADVVADVMGLEPAYSFTGDAHGGGGWKGDVTRMGLAIDRLEALGWSPRHDSAAAVRSAAEHVVDPSTPIASP